MTSAAYESLVQNAGVISLAGWTQVQLSGRDRSSFLQNMCTNDLRKLDVGQMCEAFLTDVKGKTFNGTSSSETLKGTLEADVLNGGKGNDTLKGGAGNDKLYGGAGADKLYGEAGADIFVFRAKSDSTLSSKDRDTIYDFDGKAGDRIDLSGFDANDKKGGMQDFSFIGSNKFSGKAGELRYEKVKGDTFVYADTNGDKTADFAIKFDDTITFQKGYFLL